MLKKFLTLCMVAVMFNTAVFAASPMGIALAAETETESTYAEVTTTACLATAGDMDFIKITDTNGTQTAKDDCENATATDAVASNVWYLAKIRVGSGYSSFTSMSFDIQMWGAKKGSGVSFYLVPLKATDFETAKTSAGSTLATNLTAPSATGTSFGTRTNVYGFYYTYTINGSGFTADNYDGEYIYIAFQALEGEGADYSYNMKTDKASVYKMTVKGKKAFSVDVATGSAIHIVDMKNGTQTIDVNATTADKELRGGDHKWMIYKFETGKTYEQISSATLNVTTEIKNYGKITVFLATKEQWDAANSIGDNSLTKTNQQTHFVSPRKSAAKQLGTTVWDGNATLDIDIKATCEEQIKSGEIYVFVYAGSFTELTDFSNAGNQGVGVNLKSVTLTVTGLEGAYEAPAVTDFDDSVLVWNKGNYGFYTTATSGKALLIAATYTGETLTDAEVITIDASTTKTNGGYTGTTDLTPGDSLKVFLWSEGTLVPIKSEVIEF